MRPLVSSAFLLNKVSKEKLIFHRKTMSRYIFYTLLFLTVLLFSNSYGDSPWILLSKGEIGRPDIYYNSSSIKKIDNDIIEVYNAVVYEGGRSVRQLRINCKNRELAIGRIDIISKGSDIPDQIMYHNKRGWKWFSPRDKLAQQLIDIICMES
jgi:hypothetical protein